MKFLFILSFFLSTSAFSQIDTSLHYKALEYVKTENFIKQLQDYTDNEIKKHIQEYKLSKKRADNFTKEEMERMSFWFNNKCFVIDSKYFLPISSLIDNVRDSLEIKIQELYTGQSEDTCQRIITLDPYFLNENTIEFRYFPAKAGNMWFGQGNLIRLQMIRDSWQILFRKSFIAN